MPTKAKLFIGLTIATGALFLVACLGRVNNFADLPIYISCFALALLSSALKVRLPGITGTMSTNFLFVLIATAVFSLTETVVLASVACLVQCLWKTKRKPKGIQILFNIAVLVLSSGVSYQISHRLAGNSGASLSVQLALAACLYFTINTFLISGVLSLVDSKPLMQVWQQCYLWSFPYYLAGAALSGLLVVASRTVGWKTSMLMLPVMYLVFVFYGTCVERLGERTSPAGTT